MEEKIIRVLESIGLNKNEIKVYLDLIKYDSASALDISKRTNIHRSNTYDAIRKLIERGFISEIIQEKKRMFKAMQPNKIKDYVFQRMQEVDAIIPELNQLGKIGKEENKITTCNGVFAAREAMMDLLDLNAPIKSFGAPKEIIEILGLGFLKEFHAQRIKKKISMSHIYNDDATDRIKILNKMKYTDAHCIAKQYSSSIVTLICKDTVLLFVLSNPLVTITLKDASIANSYSHYFDALLPKTRIPADKE